jgi:hypothetical protein
MRPQTGVRVGSVALEKPKPQRTKWPTGVSRKPETPQPAPPRRIPHTAYRIRHGLSFIHATTLEKQALSLHWCRSIRQRSNSPFHRHQDQG